MREAQAQRGLTLIEIMVVMAIVVILAGVAGPTIATVTGANAKKAAGELVGTTRALFDAAALRHATCRLAIDLDKRAYWAECAPGPAGIPADAEGDEGVAERFPDESNPEIRKILDASRFGEIKDRILERRELPGKTAFGPVHLEGRRDAQESGIAYVYFFPGGQAQKAWIPVVDGKNLFTVVTEPFTGRTRVVPRKVEVSE